MKDKIRVRTKKLVMIAMFIAIIFAQEELLTWIPNVQLTVLLLMIYGAVVGPLWGTVIVFAHTFLDNAFMGSLLPSVYLPMLVGWEIVMLFGWISRKWPLFLKTIMSIIGALAYCWLFVIANYLMVPTINIDKYIMLDIPFEIVLMCSSGISVALLYVPIFNVANKGYNFDKIKKESEKINEEELSR